MNTRTLTLEGDGHALETALVSVGMPVFNGEAFVGQALSSLIAEPYPNLEILISDNCSTDGTQGICLEFATRDRRIRYEKTTEPLSPLANFNRLVHIARGEYFMWAAHDDIREYASVTRLVAALDASPEAVLATSAFDNINDIGVTIRRYKEDWKRRFSGSRFRQIAFLALADEEKTQKANHIYGLIRRDALLAVEGMREHRQDFSGEDIVTLIRLRSRGAFVVVDDVLFHYRVRERAVRKNEALLPYVRRRLVGTVQGHRGNVLLYLRRHHALHSEIRTTIATDGTLPWAWRLTICLGAYLKELLALPQQLLRGARKELLR